MQTENTFHNTFDGITVGDTVRRFGDTFRNRYTVVSMVTRVASTPEPNGRGSRLYGGDTTPIVTIATVTGRTRTVTFGEITAHDAEWTDRDHSIVSGRTARRNTERARAARAARARAERAEYVAAVRARRDAWRSNNPTVEVMTAAAAREWVAARRAA